MKDILGFVSNIGFPIVLSVYLLTRIEEKLEKLNTSINNLAAIISKL